MKQIIRCPFFFFERKKSLAPGDSATCLIPMQRDAAAAVAEGVVWGWSLGVVLEAACRVACAAELTSLIAVRRGGGGVAPPGTLQLLC